MRGMSDGTDGRTVVLIPQMTDNGVGRHGPAGLLPFRRIPKGTAPCVFF